MAPSWFQILIVVLLAVLLFGRGRLSDLMGDVAKGIKSFKKGMTDDDEAQTPPAKTVGNDRAGSIDAKSPSGDKVRHS